MKITLSLALLALSASQVMAVIPRPVPECTKSVIVVPTDIDGCDAFAGRHGTTFENMLKWNDKLRPDCLNLDEGWPICISVTPGDCCLAKRGQNNTATTSASATTTVATTLTSTASGTATSGVATTTVAPSANATTATGSTAVNKPTVTTTPPPNSGAVSSKGSMVLAAAGVLLSAVYIL